MDQDIVYAPDKPWDAATALKAIAENGYVRIRLEDRQAGSLADLLAAMSDYFGQSSQDKLKNMSPDFNFGFRPFGRQYSITPDRPDLNESFTYWADDPSLIPRSAEIADFVAALSGYRRCVAGIAGALLSAAAVRFGSSHRVAFENASYLETNWYFKTAERELLQDRHEDGHVLTFAHSDAPGLEIELDGVMTPVAFQPGELLVMPGSLITYMTGGWIEPLFHQVRNHGLARRRTVLYLVNPRLDEPVLPFIHNEFNADIDINERTMNAGSMFGLPQAPVLQS